MEPVIETFGITKKFGDNIAVNEVDLSVGNGEVFGLLGPNGAGKTTLLSMLCTILKPTSGTAKVNGYDIIRQHSDVRKSIGIVFQDPSVDANMTARENLQMHSDLYSVPVPEQKERIGSVLKLVELEDKANSFVGTFSGGMRRRLEIARGLLHYPKVLFLDEPTIGLDPQSREHIWDYIRELKKREDMTIILTTHYMEEADRLCDKIAIIDHGKIVALDSPGRLKAALGGDLITVGTKESLKLSQIVLEKKLSDRVQAVNGEVKITVNNALTSIPRIIDAATASGIYVEYVSVKQPDMNDVFIHHTGRDLRHESGAEMLGRMAMKKRRMR
ncbi:ABC transporter ATP-binding protein [Methanocella sp. CWC-04]|uniref:ABC transporter ATP-binding protein n=1 Tax=Methanooceanicella nereidis TaxID=2052831 RepID=A0AAP2RDR6_9EURY|nr:ATP-binding cassette domain-containing protein [Methanocella sp. CWC-04]MCD1295419.1 ABC transporter ATP-binding protein [Methanocella sp. CWC-04]